MMNFLQSEVIIMIESLIMVNQLQYGITRHSSKLYKLAQYRP